jgi:hypothetical protein
MNLFGNLKSQKWKKLLGIKFSLPFQNCMPHIEIMIFFKSLFFVPHSPLVRTQQFFLHLIVSSKLFLGFLVFESYVFFYWSAPLLCGGHAIASMLRITLCFKIRNNLR